MDGSPLVPQQKSLGRQQCCHAVFCGSWVWHWGQGKRTIRTSSAALGGLQSSALSSTLLLKIGLRVASVRAELEPLATTLEDAGTVQCLCACRNRRCLRSVLQECRLLQMRAWSGSSWELRLSLVQLKPSQKLPSWQTWPGDSTYGFVEL